MPRVAHERLVVSDGRRLPSRLAARKAFEELRYDRRRFLDNASLTC
jgi:hypothetical protein